MGNPSAQKRPRQAPILGEMQGSLLYVFLKAQLFRNLFCFDALLPVSPFLPLKGLFLLHRRSSTNVWSVEQ